jgi:predicted phosphodiesterase
VRVALLSDMHGNAVAFRAALADVERHDVDLIVSLGHFERWAAMWQR